MAHNTLHVSLYVADIEAAVAEYRRILGIEPAKLRHDYAKFEIADPPTVLSLTLGGKPGTLSHLGIRYPGEDEVTTQLARSRTEGVALLEQPNAKCCYARANKFWVRDADGVAWEMYTLLEDIEAQTAADPELRAMLGQ
jgi:catechol 2,3-dioxygenase-like lactoylglutathione lyase family enzyme